MPVQVWLPRPITYSEPSLSIMPKEDRVYIDFYSLDPNWQEGVFCNLSCRTCGEEVWGTSEMLMWEEGDETIYQAKCPHCGRKCKIRHRDLL